MAGGEDPTKAFLDLALETATQVLSLASGSMALTISFLTDVGKVA
jgi:hypothetical protein